MEEDLVPAPMHTNISQYSHYKAPEPVESETEKEHRELLDDTYIRSGAARSNYLSSNEEMKKNALKFAKINVLKQRDFTGTICKIANDILLEFLPYVDDLLNRLIATRAYMVLRLVDFIKTDPTINSYPTLNIFNDASTNTWHEIINSVCWPRNRMVKMISSDSLVSCFMTRYNKHSFQGTPLLHVNNIGKYETIMECIVVEIRTMLEWIFYPVMEKFKLLLIAMENGQLQRVFDDPECADKSSIELKQIIDEFTEITTVKFMSQYNPTESDYDEIRNGLKSEIEEQRHIDKKAKSEAASVYSGGGIGSYNNGYSSGGWENGVWKSHNSQTHYGSTTNYGHNGNYTSYVYKPWVETPVIIFRRMISHVERLKFTVLTDLPFENASLPDALIVFGLIKTTDEFFSVMHQILCNNSDNEFIIKNPPVESCTTVVVVAPTIPVPAELKPVEAPILVPKAAGIIIDALTSGNEAQAQVYSTDDDTDSDYAADTDSDGSEGSEGTDHSGESDVSDNEMESTESPAVVPEIFTLKKYFLQCRVKDATMEYDEFTREIGDKKIPDVKVISTEFLHNVISYFFGVKMCIVTLTENTTVDNVRTDVIYVDKYKLVQLGNYDNSYVPLTKIEGVPLKFLKWKEI
jgi:hypothetical protein